MFGMMRRQKDDRGGEGRGGRGRGRGRDRRDDRPRERRDTHRKPDQAEIDPASCGKVKLYGDRTGDGALQLSFTLPVPKCEEAKVAAQLAAEKMGLKDVSVIHMESMDRGFTFFVVYARCDVEVDMADIKVPKLEHPQYDFDAINAMLKDHFDRKIVVLGACIGSDAHTVGIDAIFNMKGYLGSYGLERYPTMQALNMRAQVDTRDLVRKIVEMKADAVLISRVVTQRDEHVIELKKFLEELSRTDGVPSHLIKICGGPRITHKMAVEIGYDAGFGPGTKPVEVASYIGTEMVRRQGRETRS